MSEPFYFGGLASAIAVFFTHPLDFAKVRMQIMQKSQSAAGMPAQKIGFIKVCNTVIREEGFFTLYNGMSASLLRQMTYSTTRFGMYEKIKSAVKEPMNAAQRIGASMISGAVGAVVGCPFDVVNVRLQADGKLPVAERRGYKNAVDGIIRITREEGVRALWSGVNPLIVRGALMTCGQAASYDTFKDLILKYTNLRKTDVSVHFGASLLAGFVATAITMPMDIVKTRLMQQKSNEFGSGSWNCFFNIIKSDGIPGLFRGFWPAFYRLGPHTILTFVFLEQLKIIHQKGYL